MFFLFFFFDSLRICRTAEHKLLKFVLNRKNRTALHHLFNLCLKAECLVELNCKLNNRKRGHTCVDEIFGNIKIAVSDNLFDNCGNFLFKEC